MKNILIVLTLICSTGTFAQTKKMTNPPVVAQQQVAVASMAQPSESELSVQLGFSASGVHAGIDYNKMSSGSGLGGYFFYQAEKKSNNVIVMNQVMSFGGTYKVVVAENKMSSAYISPGFGIHMAKEASLPNATTGKQSDETLIGPVMKIGALYKAKPNFSIGIERMAITNWFNDSVYLSEASYYSVAAVFNF